MSVVRLNEPFVGCRFVCFFSTYLLRYQDDEQATGKKKKGRGNKKDY